MNYSFTNVWGQSWPLYRKAWIMLTAGVAIYLAANLPTYAVNIVQSVMTGGDQKAQLSQASRSLLAGLGCFSGLWGIFVVLPIAAGLYWMGTRAARSEYPVLSDILQGFRRFPSVLGVMVLLCIAFLIPIILAFAVLLAIVYFGIGFETFKDGVQSTDFDDCSKAAVICGSVWSVVCVVVMYWIAMRTVFAWLIVTDGRLGRTGAMRSIELSWRITQGHALSLFGLFITIGLMVSATFCCCVLPMFIVGFPLALTQIGVAYNLLLNQDGITHQSATPAA